MSNNGDSTVARLSTLAEMICDPALGARRRWAEAGTLIHDAAAAAENLFLVERGEVRLYQLSPDGSRRLVEILGQGEWFGAASIGPAATYGCQALAISDAILRCVPAPRLLAALGDHPSAAMELIRHLAARLAAATEEAGRLAFDDCRRRLVKAMLKFSHSAAASEEDGGIVLRMTHEQLAQAVGAARETVSLVITELRNAKLIQTGRNRLMFDPHVLGAAINWRASDRAYSSNNPTSLA